jgi:hypothetical protein
LIDDSRIRIHAYDLWIRIQEGQKHTDPTDPYSDPDPQHCGELWRFTMKPFKDYPGEVNGLKVNENTVQIEILSYKIDKKKKKSQNSRNQGFSYYF